MASASVLTRKPIPPNPHLDIPTCCPQCGIAVPTPDPEEAQRRISDLEAQVKLLNSKAAAAVDKLADYEDEVRSLRTQCSRLQESNPAFNPAARERPLPPPPPETSTGSRLATLSSFLPGRRHISRTSDPKDALAPPSFAGGAVIGSNSTPNLSVPPLENLHSPSPPPFATDPGNKSQSLTLVSLQTSLENERERRQKAETSLTQAQSELEELTAQLFGQANEMVATERKARAKLEERVKLLETRDSEKRRRLDRLEKAVERIERVRKLVVEHDEKMNVLRVRQMRQPDPPDEDEVYDEFEKTRYHEWDVNLKIWRRSQANSYRSDRFSEMTGNG